MPLERQLKMEKGRKNLFRKWKKKDGNVLVVRQKR